MIYFRTGRRTSTYSFSSSGRPGRPQLQDSREPVQASGAFEVSKAATREVAGVKGERRGSALK